jgi:hypothetical protein
MILTPGADHAPLPPNQETPMEHEVEEEEKEGRKKRKKERKRR